MSFRARAALGTVSQDLFRDLLGRGHRSWDSPTLLSLSLRIWNPICPKGSANFSSSLLCVQDSLKSRIQNSSHYTLSLPLPAAQTASFGQGPSLSSRAMAVTLRHPDLTG